LYQQEATLLFIMEVTGELKQLQLLQLIDAK
jgi:hypothetical protein